MKILLIGKTGQLGGSLLRENTTHKIYAPDRTELDLESRSSCEKSIKSFSPEVVINTAAFHNLPKCELEPNRAFEVNCLAIRELAGLCMKMDTRLVTFSTDYVFGGEQNVPYQESARPNPLQIYGLSKMAGEQAAMQSASLNTIIIRTCGLYGLAGARSKGGNFVDMRIEDARTKTELDMSCDQTVAPTYTGDLAKAVFKLIEFPELVPGIYHLVNEGECTWYEFTKEIYKVMGLEVDVRPVNRGGMSGGLHRPKYSVLANSKAREIGISLPHWRNALQRYIHKKYMGG